MGIMFQFLLDSCSPDSDKLLWVFLQVKTLKVWLFPITTLKIHFKSCTENRRYEQVYICKLFQKENLDFFLGGGGAVPAACRNTRATSVTTPYPYPNVPQGNSRELWFYCLCFVHTGKSEKDRDVLLGKHWCGSSIEFLPDFTSIREVVENELSLSFAFFPKRQHEITLSRFAVLTVFWGCAEHLPVSWFYPINPPSKPLWNLEHAELFNQAHPHSSLIMWLLSQAMHNSWLNVLFYSS